MLKISSLVLLTFFCVCNTFAQAVTINHHTRIWVEKKGSGKPTVILINGSIDSVHSAWIKLIPPLSKITSVLAYNRIGQPHSSPHLTLKSVTARSVVMTLRQLLVKLKLQPPYILVARASGAFYAHYFARKYPNEVVGLVSVNGSMIGEQIPETVSWLSPKMKKYIRADNKQARRMFRKELVQIKKNPASGFRTKTFSQLNFLLETLGEYQSAQEIIQLPPLSKNMSLAVLISGHYRIEDKLQRDFAKLVPHSTFLHFHDYNIDFQNVHTQSVISVIKKMIMQYRQKAGLSQSRVIPENCASNLSGIQRKNTGSRIKC